jgi:hypothetical protein
MVRKADTTLAGPIFHEPVFDEGTVTTNPTGFIEKHPSDKEVYKQIEALLKTKLAGFPKSRKGPSELYTLAEALGARGAKVTAAIKASKRIVFHVIGDSGATTGGKQYRDELGISDQLTMDCNVTEPANRPAFLFHLGDVVCDFGESQYYYDQFYAPYRNYPAPIFAIPGNHDSFILPDTAKGQTPLDVFMRNFCSEKPAVTREAASLHRTAMTQPGVYFALDAPFVRVLGLFSNALEDPGLISSEKGHWPGVPDYQLEFLQAQLEKIRDEKYAGAVVLAVHHPPFVYAPKVASAGAGGNHGGSIKMLREIDTICKKAAIYPHAVLTAHAHNYQRYTRTVHMKGQAYDVPFIVCGDGGHHVNMLVRANKGEPARERILAQRSAISTSIRRSRQVVLFSKNTMIADMAICGSARTTSNSASASILPGPALRNRASTRSPSI